MMAARTTGANVPEFMKALATRAMLVRLVIKHWSPRRVDHRATKAVESSFGSRRGRAGRFIKTLMDCEEVRGLTSARNELRRRHYDLTARFGDEDSRLLSVDMHPKYIREIDRMISKYEAARDGFCAVYERRVEEARIDLGDLFDEREYPPVAEIRRKTWSSYYITPIRTSDNFIAQVAHEGALEIQRRMDERTMGQWQDSVRFLVERIAETATAMAERLRPDEKRDGKDMIFRDTLLENARTAAETAKSLDVRQTAAVQALADTLLQGLAGIEPDALRQGKKGYEPAKREKARLTAERVKKDADEMLAGLA